MLRIGKLTCVTTIRGVGVYVHWSVFLISAIMLFGAIRRPFMTIVGLGCYLSVLLIHECGHMIAAQRKGCRVESIQLYPIHGRCCIQVPWSHYDHCVIAWGVVIAQATVALPLILWVTFFGYTSFDAINAVLAILGFFSVLVALFNLLPAGRLDGAIARGLFPEWIKRMRARRSKPSKKRPGDWRTY